MNRSAELSRREREVAQLLAEGLTNRQIADRLFIAERTAEGHVERIRGKLGFSTRSQIAAWVAGGGTSPARLPYDRIQVIGREREITELVAMVRGGDGLVTLTGPGGVGKTRLAIAVATRLSAEFPDGAWFIDLSSVQDPRHVEGTIARGLGLRPQSERSLISVIGSFLGNRRALLIIDNFEQVIAAAPVVKDLLRASPTSVVMVTSREALRLYGEQEYPVPSLAVDDGENSSPAAQLFISRARQIVPDIEFDGADDAAIKTLCRRLDGLPLAIELAAARVRVVGPAATLVLLNRSIDILTGGAQDLPARHQALTAAFEWSYGLLSPSEQQMFRLLGVFRGGCTLDAAETVCSTAEIDRANVIDLIDALCAKSLLRRDFSGAPPRFLMLETVREFATSKLEVSPEAEATRRAHIRYFRELAEREAPLITSQHELEVMARLDREQPNFRVAIEHSREFGDGETELRILGALYLYWVVRGELLESLELFRNAPLEDGQLDPDVRALAWLGAANLYISAGKAAESAMAGRKLTELAPLSSRAPRFMGIGYFAQSLEAFDDRARLKVLIDMSMGLLAEAGDPFELAFCYTLRGEFEREHGTPLAAIEAYEAALCLLRESGGELFQIAVNQTNLGQAALLVGDWGRAEAHFKEALPVARNFGAWKLLLITLYGLAEVAEAKGRAAIAAHLLGCADAGFTRAGYVLDQADRSPRDRLEAALRSRLGNAIFDELHAEGQKLDPNKVAAGPDIAD